MKLFGILFTPFLTVLAAGPVWGQMTGPAPRPPAARVLPRQAPAIPLLPPPSWRPPVAPGFRPQRPLPPNYSWSPPRPYFRPLPLPPTVVPYAPLRKNLLDNTGDLLNLLQESPRILPRSPRPALPPPTLYRDVPVLSAAPPNAPRYPPVYLGPHPLFQDYDRYLQDGKILLIPR